MDPNVINKLIGEKIETLRKSRKFSQKLLSSKVGLSRTSIVNIEKGRHQSSIPILYKFAEFFSVPINVLLPSIDEILRRSSVDKKFDTILNDSNLNETSIDILKDLFNKKNKHAK